MVFKNHAPACCFSSEIMVCSAKASILYTAVVRHSFCYLVMLCVRCTDVCPESLQSYPDVQLVHCSPTIDSPTTIYIYIHCIA